MLYEAIVIGAGLSGLTAAARLVREHGLDKSRVLVVEGGDRIGGRLLQEHGLDLGAAWSWPSNDRALASLLGELGAVTMSQHVSGMSLGEGGRGPVQEVGRDQSPSGGGSVRIVGGAGSLPGKLEMLAGVDVRVGSPVSGISVTADGEGVDVAVGDETLRAKAVVVAVPPRSVEAGIVFEPPLPEERRRAMAETATWMSNTGKVCLRFDKANRFWTDKGLNGCFFSQRGPLRQVWDNSDGDSAALCGFVFDDDLRHLESEEAFEASPIMAQLERAFGPEVHSHIGRSFQSWREHFPADAKAAERQRRTRETPYGHSVLRAVHQGRVFFASSETTPNENGHMEGAVLSGNRVAQEVAAMLGSKAGRTDVQGDARAEAC